MWNNHLFHKYNRYHVIDTVIQLYMIVGLGIRLKSMSVRSCRWTSLCLPQNPRIAARVLLKRANLSFVWCILWQMHTIPAFFSYFFWVFWWLCCILVPSLHWFWRQGNWMKTSLCQSLCGGPYPSLFHVVGRPLPEIPNLALSAVLTFLS